MIKFLFALSLMGLGFGCAKQSDNSTTTSAVYQFNQTGQCVSTQNGAVVPSNYCSTTNSGYQLNQSGLCISSTTGQPVPYNYCSTTNSAYQLNGFGQCVMTSTGNHVPANYCQQSNQYSQPCYGQYVSQTYGNITCYGSNCSGLTVYSVTTGQTQYCQ